MPSRCLLGEAAAGLEQNSHRESAVSSGSCHQTVPDLFSDLGPLGLAAFLFSSLTSCMSFYSVAFLDVLRERDTVYISESKKTS